MARPTGCQFTVQTGDEGDVVVIVIGDLDPASARVLVELVESGIGSPGTSRGLQVDLRRVRACSNSGMRALTACVEMGAGLREGVHFRVGIVPDASD
jgi:anti-anti-sigma regulatory factor